MFKIQSKELIKKIGHFSCFLLPFLLFSLAIFPIILKSGYVYDDMYNVSSSAIKYFGTSVSEMTFTIMMSWVKNGRLFPFSSYTYFLFDILSTRIGYKLFLSVFVLSNAVLLFLVMKRYMGKTGASFFLLFYPLFCNLNCEYFNALFGFHALVQFVFALCLASVWLFQIYLESDKKSYLLFSTLLYFISLFTYELSFGFILIHLLVLAEKTKKIKSAALQITPIFSVWILGLLFNVILRSVMSENLYTEATINIPVILKTFFNQLSSSIPLISYSLNAERMGYPLSVKEFFTRLTVTDVLISILFASILAMLTYKIYKKELSLSRKSFIFTLLIGLMLTAFPAGIISLSSRYQSEISLGVGYLPSYISSFGIAIIIFTIYCKTFEGIFSGGKILKIIGILSSSVIILLSSVCLVLNLFIGQTTTEKMYTFSSERDIITSSIKAGVFDNINENDILVGTTKAFCDENETPMFYSQAAKRKIQAVPKSFFSELSHGETKQLGSVNISYNGTAYAIFHVVDKNVNGIVVIAEISETEKDNILCSGDVTCYIKNSTGSCSKSLIYDGKILPISASDNNNKETVITFSMGTERFDITKFAFIDVLYEFEGQGTHTSPYLINTPEDLEKLAKNVNRGVSYINEYFLQTTKIDLAKYENWTPIGTFASGYSFSGIYDGGGHTISNLNIDSSLLTDQNVGLFGILSGTVCNLGIESGCIRGAHIGSIASHSAGDNALIINCYNKATLIALNRGGGIADNFSGGEIINCVNLGKVLCAPDTLPESVILSGIVSYNAAKIDYCYSEVILHTGYFTGELSNSNISADITTLILNSNINKFTDIEATRNIKLKNFIFN